MRQMRQQIALTKAILIHKKRGLKVKELNFYEFPNGYFFFSQERLSTDEPLRCICYNNLIYYLVSNVVVIHNNFIVGTAAKDYRFKELMLYNENVTYYYQNKGEKYIWFNTTNIIKNSIY